jgi:hypothetical protein
VGVSTRTRRAVTVAAAVSLLGCATVDPGPNPPVADQTFNADYFYCHVEPEFIFARKCGPGDPAHSDNGCHFSSAVSGMTLIDHPPVDCGGGDHPINRAQIGANSAALGNFEHVSFEMSKDYLTAPLFVRPSSDVAHGRDNPSNHPRAIFDQGDTQVQQLLGTWAVK